MLKIFLLFGFFVQNYPLFQPFCSIIPNLELYCEPVLLPLYQHRKAKISKIYSLLLRNSNLTKSFESDTLCDNKTKN